MDSTRGSTTLLSPSIRELVEPHQSSKIKEEEAEFKKKKKHKGKFCVLIA